MKKVAGTLRLDLASFRELESFAQFGSDLDKATQAKLNRGQRTVEVLKQGLHEPQRVEYQVAIIYALVNGYLDDIPVEDVQRFEEGLHAYMKQHASDILQSIRETEQLPDKEAFNKAIEGFKNTFSVSEQK